MKAIILSAGQGRRLLPLTSNVPKCCLMLDGKTLLAHQVESLAANGVDDIVVVTGFNHHLVDEVVSGFRDVSVRTLYNPFYAVSDNLGTCWVARKEMTTPFLLLNGDTLFEPSTLAHLLYSERIYPITLAVDRKHRYDEDDMKINADGEQLNRVGKKLKLDTVNGESIGMMIFNRAGADAFVQTVEQLMAGPDGLVRWYLSAVDKLAAKGLVGISSIQGHDWCEVDDLIDFAHAEKAMRNWRDRSANTRNSKTRQTSNTRQKVA
ncbi:MAG TPA: phosphocholine cytidylyltransferase family protein [Xanthomonadales bacterium]